MSYVYTVQLFTKAIHYTENNRTKTCFSFIFKFRMILIYCSIREHILLQEMRYMTTYYNIISHFSSSTCCCKWFDSVPIKGVWEVLIIMNHPVVAYTIGLQYTSRNFGTIGERVYTYIGTCIHTRTRVIERSL